MGNGEDKSKSKALPADFDQALLQTGYGRFHYEILAVCALSIISVGFQNGLSAYVFTAAQCELHLTSFQLGFLNVSFLIGGILSSFLWGVIADAKGRKPVLILTHLSNASITLLCALNKSVLSLIVCRFFNGFFIGAPGSIIFSYLGEFQPAKYRAATICYSGLFFTSSLLFLPLLSWIFVPLNINYSINAFFTITSWRIFLIVLIIPEIITGLWLLKLPESPKFYIAKGDESMALQVLQKIWAINSGKDAQTFPVKKLLSETETEKIDTKKYGSRTKIVRTLHEMHQQFKKLFGVPLRTATILTSTIMFTNMFGAFGLGLWLPELFIRFEHASKLNTSLNQNSTASIQLNAGQVCKSLLDSDIIRNTLIMGVTSLVGNALSGWFAPKVPLKSIPFITMLIGGLSTFTIYFLNTSVEILIAASLFQANLMTANMTIGSVVIELFPTAICSMAICLIMCAGRIGAMVSNLVLGYFMDINCAIPIFTAAVVILIGAGLCLLLPQQTPVSKKCNNNKDIEISVIKI